VTMRRLALGAALALPVAALAFPAGAWAHGLVGKGDLPLPKWLFAWAAAVVLVASFVGLAILWATPRLQQVEERRRFALPAPRLLEVIAGALGVAAFAVTVYAGFAGVQVERANLAPTVVFVIFWVGIPFAAFLFGDVFRPFNPWLAVGRAVGWAVRKVGGDSVPEPLPYPEKLGHWPAAVGIFLFCWVELVYGDRGDPSQLATMAVVYAAIQLVGMSLFGAEAWSRRGDAFGVAFNLYSRISPLHWRDGALYTRPPLAGLPQMETVSGTVGLVLVMIGTTTFDGFSMGDLWGDVSPHVQDVFEGLGLGPQRALEAAGTVMMLVVILLMSALYRVGIEGMRTIERKRRRSAEELSRSFIHTLVPIALAYVVAHYFSLLVFQSQAMPALLSDPLGDGSDLFGWADKGIDYTIISATGVWYVQVVALVVGHVAGLVLAHDRALALYRRARDATRSQYWMLAVMVGFTSLGLWLLSST